MFLRATRTRKIRMFNIQSHTPDFKQIDAADVRFRRKVRRLLGRGDRLIVEMLADTQIAIGALDDVVAEGEP